MYINKNICVYLYTNYRLYYFNNYKKIHLPIASWSSFSFQRRCWFWLWSWEYVLIKFVYKVSTSTMYIVWRSGLRSHAFDFICMYINTNICVYLYTYYRLYIYSFNNYKKNICQLPLEAASAFGCAAAPVGYISDIYIYIYMSLMYVYVYIYVYVCINKMPYYIYVYICSIHI